MQRWLLFNQHNALFKAADRLVATTTRTTPFFYKIKSITLSSLALSLSLSEREQLFTLALSSQREKQQSGTRKK
jgi:hypothetical protein